MKRQTFQILALVPFAATLVSCVAADGPADPPPTPARTTRTTALQPQTSYSLPAAARGDDVTPPQVDRCYLSRDSDELLQGTVSAVSGPVVPADPCDVTAYRFSEPYFDITLKLANGTEREVFWLPEAQGPGAIQVGDEILGGSRSISSGTFLRNFVFVNSTRMPARATGLPASASDVISAGLQQSCATFQLSDAQFWTLLHRRPNVHCGATNSVPVREPWEHDDVTN